MEEQKMQGGSTEQHGGAKKGSPWIPAAFAVVGLAVIIGVAVKSKGSPPALANGTAVRPPSYENDIVWTPTETTGEPVASGETSAAETFTIVGGNFTFDLKEIRVKQGDTVKITFNNQEGFHDWVVDEFNARTPRIKAGETADVTFVADKVGTFEYYCSVGEHRKFGMKGNLIVE